MEEELFSNALEIVREINADLSCLASLSPWYGAIQICHAMDGSRMGAL